MRPQARPTAVTMLLVLALLATAASTALATGHPTDRDQDVVLTLGEAVARAMDSHPSVGAARAAVEAAEAGVARARAAYWPALSAGATVMRYEEPSLVAPLHGFDLMAPPEFDDKLLRTNLSANWTLYDGGAREARVRGARAGEAAAAAMSQGAEQALVASVTLAYLEVVSARDVLEASDRYLEALSAERERVRLFLDEGRAAQLEMLRANAALADARASRVETTSRLDLAEANLARLIGSTPDVVRADRLVELRLITPGETRTLDALIRAAEAGSPQLERARRAVTAADANRRLAASAWIPSVDVFGSYLGFAGEEMDLVTEWQMGAALSFPLFTGGERMNAHRAAKADARRAREDLRLAELDVATGVDAALNALAMAAARAEAVAEAARHQEEVTRTEMLTLRTGAGTQTDYLRAEADLLRIRSALVEARNSKIAAGVELARVTGELTSAWLDENLESLR